MVKESVLVKAWNEHSWLETCFANRQSFITWASKVLKPGDIKVVLSEEFESRCRFHGKHL
jgi:hypothetical protein